jgi:hypothetical protein
MSRNSGLPANTGIALPIFNDGFDTHESLFAIAGDKSALTPLQGGVGDFMGIS